MIPLTPLSPESDRKMFCNIRESVDEILKTDHLNESPSLVLSIVTDCFIESFETTFVNFPQFSRK